MRSGWTNKIILQPSPRCTTFWWIAARCGSLLWIQTQDKVLLTSSARGNESLLLQDVPIIEPQKKDVSNANAIWQMPIQAFQAEQECKSSPDLELAWHSAWQTSSATGSLCKLPHLSRLWFLLLHKVDNYPPWGTVGLKLLASTRCLESQEKKRLAQARLVNTVSPLSDFKQEIKIFLFPKSCCRTPW